MKLTVLGNSGPYPSKDAACSSYALQLKEDAPLILLDLGSGALVNYQKLFNLDMLEAVFLTHLHFDHMSDMLVLRYALEKANKKIKLYLPSTPVGVVDMLRCEVFDMSFIEQGSLIQFKGFNILPKRTTHPVETYALRINESFTYSSDLAIKENMVDFAEGSEVMLMNSAFLHKQKLLSNPPHLSALECASIAKEFKVEMLLLAHFPPGASHKEYVNEARELFENTFSTEILRVYEV